ncbi:MAG: hypothetical protein JKY15_08150 [Deltaproteobacteria bacterium]|nr:hypothetical protein [Deltaproteobacteria bacterium]
MIDLKLLKELSEREPKKLLERTVKLQEEVGELAQEVLIHQKVSGTQHKSHGQDGILGECVDVALVALSIYFYHGGDIEDLEACINKKFQKWRKHQKV